MLEKKSFRKRISKCRLSQNLHCVRPRSLHHRTLSDARLVDTGRRRDALRHGREPSEVAGRHGTDQAHRRGTDHGEQVPRFDKVR